MTLFERASCYVSTLPAAISGSRGHDALFRVACILVNGVALQDAEAWPILPYATLPSNPDENCADDRRA